MLLFTERKVLQFQRAQGPTEQFVPREQYDGLLFLEESATAEAIIE
jgi:hypothetical protein